MSWLAKAHPELVPEYRNLYRRGAYLPAEYREMLRDRAAPLVRKHGLVPDRRSFRAAEAPPASAEPAGQRTLF